MTLKPAAVSQAIAPTAVRKNSPLWNEGTRTNESAPATLPLQRQKQSAIISQNTAKYLARIWSHQLVLPLIFYLCLFILVCLFFYLVILWLRDQILTPKATVCCTMARWHWVCSSKSYFTKRGKQWKHQSERISVRCAPKKNKKSKELFATE